MYSEKTDEALAGLLKQNDHSALKSLFSRYYKILCGVSAVYTKDHALAEEIVASLFMRLWDNRHTSTIQNVKSYLLISAKNASLNHTQKKKEPVQFMHGADLEPHATPDARTPFNILSGREGYQSILQVIDTLPAAQRQVLIMSRIEHLSKHEIAETLGISVRTVETTLYQSIQKLRALLKNRYNLNSGS